MRPAPDPNRPITALPPERSWRFVWTRWLDFNRERFWIIPAILMVLGMIFAILTAYAEDFGVPARYARGFAVRDAAADTILGILATSMLTFVGVVFTLTLVAMQLGSAQLSPRVIRTFTRATLPKVAFGIFLATFGFAVVMLVLDDDSADARSRAVTSAAAMVLLSLTVFIAYVATTIRMLEVSRVITAVAEETRKAIRVNHPGAESYVTVTPPRLDEPEHSVTRLPLPPATRPRSGQFGVVLGINRARLVQLAERHGVILEVLCRHGEYVPSGGELVASHGGPGPSEAEVVRCFHLGRARTLYQDPAFGIRALVDVAIQALSPALNQPGTAVMVIDRLEDLLLRIARQPLPNGQYVDATGVVRLVEPVNSWGGLLDLAFTEILANGQSSPQVTRRLADVFGDLAREVPDELGPDLERHRAALGAAVHKLDDPATQEFATRPHPLGMG